MLAVLLLVVVMISGMTLPRSKFFVPSAISYVKESGLFFSHLSNRRLLVIYLLVFCFMGAIISIFNALPFRMESPPFNISPSVYGTFFWLSWRAFSPRRPPAPWPRESESE